MRGDRGFPDGGRVHGAASSSSATSAMRTPTTLPARLASDAIRSTVNASIRLMDARCAHCCSSGNATRSSLRKTELPSCLGPCWSGSAIRFPKPPRGMVSWLGNSRSYESMPSSCRLAIVSVMRWQPILRAVAAATGVAKKNQTCAPLPERERSTATGSPIRRLVCTNARTSSIHALLSKSTARNQQVSSSCIG